MLRELHISNLAVIEDVTVELAPGLNCFTGQTGAGKSLVLGALEILLGLRSGSFTDMIRPGAEEARVSGVFEVHDPWTIQEVAQAADLTLHPGDELLLTRRIFASGRSSLALNGQPATTGMIRRVAELLVDVHGQHDHQFLLKPANQLVILDGFAGTTQTAQEWADLRTGLRERVRRRQELTDSRTLRQQQLDLYEFQAQEIDTADPQPGEFGELKARHARLSNLQRIKKEAGSAFAALHESEGAVLERLQMIAHILGELALLDEQLRETAEAIRASTLALQDGAFDLQRYVERLDLDPGELAEVEDRLNTLNRLIAKYAAPRNQARNMPPHGPPPASASPASDALAAVLEYRNHLGREIENLRNQDQDLGRLDQEIQDLEARLDQQTRALTKARQAAATKLRPLVEAQMHELGMADAALEVEFTPAPAEEDLPSGPPSIEMLVRTNPGQPARPLRKIASGGELSRIMLALKSILAQSDRISVLVFDEIDANIGGRMGTIIGTKLRRLAQGDLVTAPPGKRKARTTGFRGQQVLCITHLPQIAAFAQRHFRIAKEVAGSGPNRITSTHVAVLEGEARIEELAEMLAGKDATATTRKQAREMLELV